MKRGCLWTVCSIFLLIPALLSGGALSIRSTSAAKMTPLGTYYLALGDSFSVGYQPHAEPTTHGWVYLFSDMLNTIHSVKLQNLAVNGECAFTLIKGGLDPACSSKKINSPSQLAEAVTFLHQHAGLVNPITVEIGANDVGSNITALLADAPAQQAQLFANLLSALTRNWTFIFKTLRTACPACEIITVNQYDPYPPGVLNVDAKALTAEYNLRLQQAAAPLKVRLADVYTPFIGHELTYTWISDNDDHPTNLGYKVIAEAVARASGYPVKMQQ